MELDWSINIHAERRFVSTNSVRENATELKSVREDLKKAIEDVIVPMFCSTALNASDEEQLKLQKVRLYVR
jgi:hypothetical protein